MEWKKKRKEDKEEGEAERKMERKTKRKEDEEEGEAVWFMERGEAVVGVCTYTNTHLYV